MDKQRRREMTRQYRESHRPHGVFRVHNTTDDKSWVSSSVNLPASLNKIRMQLETNTMLQVPTLQKDFARLGPAAFEIEVLEELEPPDAPEWDPRDDLEALLALWLEQLQPWGERGYNRKPADKS